MLATPKGPAGSRCSIWQSRVPTELRLHLHPLLTMEWFSLQAGNWGRIGVGATLALTVASWGMDVWMTATPLPVSPAVFYVVGGVVAVATLIPELRYGCRRMRGDHPVQLEPKLFHDEAFLMLHNHGPSDTFRVKLLDVKNIQPAPRLPLTLQWKDRAGDERTVSGAPEAFGICRYSFQRMIEHRGEEPEAKCEFQYKPYAISSYFESTKVEMPSTGAGWHVEAAFKIKISSEEHELAEEAWVALKVEVRERDKVPFSDWVDLGVQGQHASEALWDSVRWPHPDADEERGENRVRFRGDLWERYGHE